VNESEREREREKLDRPPSWSEWMETELLLPQRKGCRELTDLNFEFQEQREMMLRTGKIETSKARKALDVNHQIAGECRCTYK
jgi:hypothetical protein